MVDKNEMRPIPEEEVLRATLEYFDGDELATNVWMTKYCLKDSAGNLYERTPDDMHRRLAREFARIEAKYPNPLSEEKIYNLFRGFKRDVPQGSPMATIGNPFQISSTSNCFVVESPYDSYGGILLTDQELAHVFRRRGGCGVDISTIRPRGLPTANAAKTTDGIGVFMERFSNTTREVAQNGRRGALMMTISVHHPEIKTFINIKKDRTKVTGANISIRLTDEFMNAVVEGDQLHLRFPVDKTSELQVSEFVDAREIWDEIIDAAWECAEPGLIFWDKILQGPADIYAEFKSISTNPCAELPKCADDSCRLMLINLLSYVKNKFSKDSYFDLKEFHRDVVAAQRLMDDLVDLELEHIDRILEKVKSDPESDDVKAIEINLWRKIREKCERGRRTGLGITALGDALAACNIVYGSEDSIEKTEEIYKTLCLASYESSITLAEERGHFPAWDAETEKGSVFIQKILAELPRDIQDKYAKCGRRNIANLTTAPAGSVSCLTQTTSGIEPVYLLEMNRNRKVTEGEDFDFTDELGDHWKRFVVRHRGVKDWMEITGETEIAKSPYWGATSNDIDWIASVKLQAAAQRWVCHSISKTCNLPKDATKELVANVYMEAWKSGCKGFTVYRDGSRMGVLSSLEEDNESKFNQSDATKRPESLPCEIHRTTVKGERFYILVGLLDGKPYEVFGGPVSDLAVPEKVSEGTLLKRPFKTVLTKYDLEFDGGEVKDVVSHLENPEYGVHTRLISLALRHGAKVSYVVEQLRKDPDSSLISFSRATARVLKKYIEDGQAASSERMEGCETPDQCQLSYQEGCISCNQCGLSKCS